MFYIRLHNGLPREVTDTRPDHDSGAWAKDPHNGRARGWMTSRDFETFEQAKRMAGYITFMTGETYLPADEGEGTSPRYRIVKAPKLGDKVSKSFNGDTYPCGEIIKITPTWIVTTDTGQKFRRWKQSGGWREQGRGFWMLHGHRYEQNPHF